MRGSTAVLASGTWGAGAEDGPPGAARRVRAAWTVARRVKGPSREEVVLTVATGKGSVVRRGPEEAREANLCTEAHISPREAGRSRMSWLSTAKSVTTKEPTCMTRRR